MNNSISVQDVRFYVTYNALCKKVIGTYKIFSPYWRMNYNTQVFMMIINEITLLTNYFFIYTILIRNSGSLKHAILLNLNHLNCYIIIRLLLIPEFLAFRIHFMFLFMQDYQYNMDIRTFHEPLFGKKWYFFRNLRMKVWSPYKRRL